ncbi:hypothetical protein PAPHI01_0202 [Pancytospora philotis]|nr:hypothetical protein PAPHI01_0202 [Pancytospora philotis]
MEKGLPAINRLLEIKQQREDAIQQQRGKIRQLEAHKRTLVAMLAPTGVGTGYPSSIAGFGESLVAESRDFSKYYVLNLGSLPANADSRQFSLPCPTNYKILRKFAKHGSSKAAHPEILYTSTVCERNGQMFYTIRDDENNTWRGEEGFAAFKTHFSQPLPFATIEEWLALGTREVKALISGLYAASSTAYPRRPATLPGYFTNTKNY